MGLRTPRYRGLNRSRKTSLLVSFRIRSFRYQWPADLLASFAFEMETLILGWYVLVETGSVFLLTVFGSLRYIGTLIAPLVGVVGDRLGRRKMLCSMRAIFLALASIVMTLGLTDLLAAYHVFAIALLTGLVRTSDMAMRNALIGDTIPASTLMNALGLARLSQDAARIFGALAGAGLFSVLGIGQAYVFVAGFYLMSFALTMGVSKVRPSVASRAPSGVGGPDRSVEPSHWRELKEGLVYIWNTPTVLAVMWLAFLVNLTAFPVTHGLLPFVAREVYLIDEKGLSHLLAGFAGGALIGSLAMAWTGGKKHAARFMLVNILLWYAMLAVFARFESKFDGLTVLFVMGVVHSMAMISMSVTLLGTLIDQVRGRVMGVRTLAVYGLPTGLLGAGILIESVGFSSAIGIYAAVGLLFTAFIGYRWRSALWH